MAGNTLTTIDGILKDFYTDVVREQTALASPIHDKFEKQEDVQWDGRKAIEVAVMSHNEGIGAIGEDANLPTAGNFVPKQFEIPMRYVYAVFRMTKQAMESAASSRGAFKNAMRYEMESMIRNLKRERARMIWGYGEGRLALVNGAVISSTTVNVDAPGGVAGSVGGGRLLRAGMILAIDSGTNVAATIASVAAGGTSITTSAAISCDDNSVIYRLSTPGGIANTNEWSKDNEPMGILGLIDDGTYVGTLMALSRTTYPQLKSRVETSVGALTLDVLQKNFDIAGQLGEGNIQFLTGHHSVRRAYLALLEADRRYTGSDLQSPDGGTKAVKRGQYVTFGGVPIIEDRTAPYDMLFGVDPTDMKRYVQVEGEWADEDGAVLSRESGKDSWTAFYRIFENYHHSRPNTCFRLEGITSSKVYVASY